MDKNSYDTSSLRTGVMAGSTCPVEVMVVANACNDDFLFTARVNKGLNMFPQFFHVVAVSGSAGISENHQITPDLRSGNAGFRREVVRMDIFYPFTGEVSITPEAFRDLLEAFHQRLLESSL